MFYFPAIIHLNFEINLLISSVKLCDYFKSFGPLRLKVIWIKVQTWPVVHSSIIKWSILTDEQRFSFSGNSANICPGAEARKDRFQRAEPPDEQPWTTITNRPSNLWRLASFSFASSLASARCVLFPSTFSCLMDVELIADTTPNRSIFVLFTSFILLSSLFFPLSARHFSTQKLLRV